MKKDPMSLIFVERDGGVAFFPWFLVGISIGALRAYRIVDEAEVDALKLGLRRMNRLCLFLVAVAIAVAIAMHIHIFFLLCTALAVWTSIYIVWGLLRLRGKAKFAVPDSIRIYAKSWGQDHIYHSIFFSVLCIGLAVAFLIFGTKIPSWLVAVGVVWMVFFVANLSAALYALRVANVET